MMVVLETHTGHQSILRGPHTPRPTGKALMRLIVAEVADESGITVADIMGRSQFKRIARPRQEAMARIHATGRFSYSQVGRFMGRDHSTVMHGVRKAAERVSA